MNNLRLLQRAKAKAEADLAKYPTAPHDGVSDEEIQANAHYRAILGQIAQGTEDYGNNLLETSEYHLEKLATGTERLNGLTRMLVLLTVVLSIATVLDVLIRLGWA